ncbi:ankyrin repeat domain-containing protein [Nitrosomonas sp. PY1]|uniref:ankyrin repeat domain-containing protein n=1 Tax=Nitrosomonas sp. PY1 TaxID=1803906 RepID=UPI001FC86BB2|nr:ankyrin repeat domain-containing protein [Nitrosomonas sp. PY1]
MTISIAAITFLLSLNVAADVQSDFFRAIDKDSLSLASEAIKNGANVDQPNQQGYTPLMIAAQTDNLRLTNFLLELNANPNLRNQHGETAIMLASYYGRTDMVKVLYSKGAEIHHAGWNPLIYASTNGFLDVMCFLLDAKADINAVSPNGTTALMMAVRSNHYAAAELLLERGADVNIRNENGENSLNWAEKAGYSSIVSLLKKHGATQ